MTQAHGDPQTRFGRTKDNQSPLSKSVSAIVHRKSKLKSLDPACPGWTTPGSRTIRGKTHLTANYTVPCFGFIALRPSALITAKGSRGVAEMYDLVDLPYEMPMCRNVRSHLDLPIPAPAVKGEHTLKGPHRDLG
ncbi:unnamed protein product [Penicillium pancosmium]